MKCLEVLFNSVEENRRKFPLDSVRDLWEEIWGAWCEEVRESRRALCRSLGTDNPRKEDVKFLALTLDPRTGKAAFQFPNTFDLDAPDGYYRRVVVPRKQWQLENYLHENLHAKTPAPPRPKKVGEGAKGDPKGKSKTKAGELSENSAAGTTEGQDVVGGKSGGMESPEAVGGKAKGKGAKSTPPPKGKGAGPEGPKAAYPTGKTLTKEEQKLAVQHQPLDTNGKPICWDACCHVKCKQPAGKCPHSHTAISGYSGLHWCVIASLYRRGGLLSGPPVPPEQVNGRIEQLRQQAQQEAKRKAHKAGETAAADAPEPPQPKAGSLESWTPPAEYQQHFYTEMEQELNEFIAHGPDTKWLRDSSEGQTKRYVQQAPDDPEAVARRQTYATLKSQGVFSSIEAASDYLKSHVMARVVNSLDSASPCTVQQALQDAVSLGCPQLEEEAIKFVAPDDKVGSAGQPEAMVSPPSWDEHGVGTGYVVITDQRWSFVDYQDTLGNSCPAAAALWDRLGLRPDQREKRQCLSLSVGAGIAYQQGAGQLPTVSRVHSAAILVRTCLWDGGLEAASALGDAPAWMTEAESLVRMHSHDAIYPHHDKDWRCLASFPVDSLRGWVVHIHRVDPWGRLRLDRLIGDRASVEADPAFCLLIKDGHTRLLLEPHRGAAVALFKHWQQLGKPTRDVHALGWAHVLDTANPQLPLVAASRGTCQRCKEHRACVHKVGEAAPALAPLFKELDVSEQHALLAESEVPLCATPMFAWGPRLRELYAGKAGLTKAVRAAGIPADEPIELYEDPDHRKGRKPSHDLLDPAVHAQQLLDAAAPPGPDTANIWHFACPCTSFSDFNVLNGGTRTFANPEGDGTVQSEIEGNRMAENTSELIEVLADNAKEFAWESSGPSGKYPKLWDVQRVRQARAKTGALVVAVDQCEHGKAPRDRPDLRTRKRSWWLVSRKLYLFALLIARRCSGAHVHMIARGMNPEGVSRCQEAAEYPPALNQGWALVFLAAFWGTAPAALPPSLAAAGADLTGLEALAQAVPKADFPGKVGEMLPQEAPQWGQLTTSPFNDYSGRLVAPIQSSATTPEVWQATCEWLSELEVDQISLDEKVTEPAARSLFRWLSESIEPKGRAWTLACHRRKGPGPITRLADLFASPIRPDLLVGYGPGARARWTKNSPREPLCGDEIARNLEGIRCNTGNPGYEGKLSPPFEPSHDFEGIVDWSDWLMVAALEASPADERCGSRPAGADQAKTYIDFVWGKEWSAANLAKAAELGDILVRTTGSLQEAAKRPFETRTQTHGNHLDGVKDPVFAECLTSEHWAYLKEMTDTGVPSRRYEPRSRLKAKPHSSAVDHLAEVFEKAWSDTAFGGVLWLTPKVEDLLSEMVESPNGWVPKQLPNRTLSSEGRIILDMRIPNAAGSKYEHPPALQPRHSQIARKATWWRARHPKIDQISSKRDVSRAFKWHFLRPEDAPEFAASLPGKAIGLAATFYCVYLTMVFGWTGAPGEYVAFMWGAKSFHEFHRPMLPDLNDTVSFSGDWLMDFSVLLEPLLGDRPWQSAQVIEEGMRRVWGPGAINAAKKEEEGKWSVMQLVWGLYMCFAGDGEVSLPEPKRIKGQCLLRLPELQPGFRKVPLRLAREVAGLAQHWCAANPALLHELDPIYRMLSQEDGGSPWVNPRGDADQRSRRWEEWDEALEHLRFLLEDDEQWHATFQAAFCAFLSPREMVGLPGMCRRTRITGGDSTMTRTGAIDWKDKLFMLAPAEEMMRLLRERVEDETHESETIVALTEVITYVQLLAARGECWCAEGVRLIVYVTDNTLTKGWIRTRRARNRHARICLRMVERLEAKFGLRTISFYIRTFRNDTADLLTREDVDTVTAHMHSKGFSQIEPPEGWVHLVDNVVNNLCIIPGDNPGYSRPGQTPSGPEETDYNCARAGGDYGSPC